MEQSQEIKTAEYNTQVPYKEGEPITFPNFMLTYTGRTTIDRGPHGPTVTIQKDTFTVKDTQGVETIVTVTTVQNPPEPTKFEANNQTYTLAIFALEDGTRLETNHLMVIA